MPPLNPSQTGQMCPTKRRETGGDAEFQAEIASDQRRGRAFQHVEQQRQRREALLAGPKHVGGADVARADLADVAEAGGARDQQTERDRAEQIAEDERGDKI